ncbi:beta-1,4-glucuronyltransferase 1-like [Schistocerca piceifrons]|uniref:beta-1,4-glucuronyltransferase 1-like n=1 Tax=Schistocerca piceifrons TaxID=274613 RepID=UPI001F5F791A|nr:beta-1,4-glucuronyltransferase 1-like [Schistocerca piceifrons]
MQESSTQMSSGENQWLSNLSYWENQKESSKMSVSYDAGKYSFWYEPIYVAQTSAPLYDERFIGYGLTRNTQIYEMYLDGWSFKILNNIFLVHWDSKIGAVRVH